MHFTHYSNDVILLFFYNRQMPRKDRKVRDGESIIPDKGLT